MDTERTRTSATVKDLRAFEGRAELVGGELIPMSPTGFQPSRAGLTIAASLREYERTTRRGHAMPDNAAYIVSLPGRSSFSPDASFDVGPPTGGQFMDGAPLFTAEVRSEGDYGTAAEARLAAKRNEYFCAGTSVVWDVDVLPRPGWSLAVDDLPV